MTEVSAEGKNEGSGKAAFTIAEFGAAHGIGKSLIYEEISAGRLRCRKVGRRTLILASDAVAWRNALPDGRAVS
jgi:hypothetical protein